MTYTGTLTEWKIEDNYGAYRLVGKIYGDIRKMFDNGDVIYTSTLQSIDFVNMVAKTKNSVYKLAEC